MSEMRMARLRLHPAEVQRHVIRIAASLMESDGSRETLWWEVPLSVRGLLTDWSDPWLIGFVFPIMQRKRPVHIEGRVSPSLLENVERFMHIWSSWKPGKYQPCELTADETIEQPPAANPGVAVASFSCGLDSSFTVYRHARSLLGRRSRKIGIGIIQHGFDVTLDQEHSDRIFNSLRSDATAMLESLGIPCVPLKSNFRQLQLDWADALGTQLVSGMSLFSGGYDVGLVANDVPYFEMNAKPWPLHPITSVLLGSDRFKVIEDGFECSRIEKAKTVSAWPEGMRYLRVCFGVSVPDTHENCGHCDKCLRTQLAFRIAGCARPSSFKGEPSIRAIKTVRIAPSTRASWRLLVQRAQQAGFAESNWVKAMRVALRREMVRTFRSQFFRPFVPLRSIFRRLTRGADISRNQMRALAKADVERKLLTNK